MDAAKIAVVIPCFKVTRHVATVLSRIGEEVSRIYCVDDACPEKSGEFIKERCGNARVTVLFHEENQGVGVAVMTGYRHALADGADIVVKLDGDGQMDPRIIPKLVRPLVEGHADYAKGNRFHDLEKLKAMPLVRTIGNGVLSFLSKLSTGYWNLFDPTNGLTAVHARVLEELPFGKISRDYFFESDMLLRLNILGAVVADIPMKAVYGEEESGLRIRRAVPIFLFRHVRNLAKRIAYSYYLRGFSIASIELVLGLLLLPFGTAFGLQAWIRGSLANVFASAGTVMVASLPIILGTQFILSFINFDISSVPTNPLHRRL